MILYYVGKRPASPKPCRYDEVWSRPWLKKHIKSGCFLTKNPKWVYINHGIQGNIYVYNVSMRVICQCGGIHTFDGAQEILIPKDIWDKEYNNGIKFLGKTNKYKIIPIENIREQKYQRKDC